ncbi:cysteine peptidase family C39 domain-containing protein [Rubripirellula amarantea]|uniref:Peptidase C39 domain-containing protein n=1 Tax=Rubripirellula amarantea TaxID=2527999 RepID=A0A5C5WF47_9BACT|nr:cysteine peptidase family C39 domain-containing protein [Rubripirellula amarantea]MDA8743230.1 cysteine peptidase family C39 domain-containing protein [Rubripirellula amarantea]TWT49496.1 hypothetical protein Pla22_46930 [Rubripirellula amarantea]
MSDLWIAIGTMGTLGVLVAIAMAMWLRPPSEFADLGSQPSVPSHWSSWIASIAALSSLALIFFSKDRIFWANWIPSSAAIVWSNLTVIALAVAAGAAYRLPRRPKWRQVFGAVSLLFLMVATLFQPILQPLFRPVYGGNQWADGGVCIQSHDRTCSAAAGATLLRASGVEVSEAQMVQWCLTDARGTPSLGLWRGLVKATAGQNTRPMVIKATAIELIESGPYPCIVVVGLPRFGADPKYVRRYGWAPGFRHSVVLFGIKPDGMVDIGDPAIGREAWSQEDLRVLYRDEAIVLAPRSPT